jgi:hypothetical protein
MGARIVGTLPIPIAKITFNPETRCYGFTINFPGHPIHHRIDSFETV